MYGQQAGDNTLQNVLDTINGIGGAFHNPLPSFLTRELLVGVGCGIGFRMVVYYKAKNAKKFRQGVEYGSARWGTAKDIEPYVDPVFENNVLLTATERLMMSGRPKQPKYARNKNILVIGGSGSGKTRFFVKPNLMQMHSSYVVTDTKGTVLVECGRMLSKKENEIETELAVHIADRYILMHECEEGYDYSILDEQYHLLDGGVYDNPDITIRRVMDMVIADLKEPRFSVVTEQYYRDEYLQGEVYAGSEVEIVDYEELSEKAEEVEQADLEAKQAEFRENNPDVVADFRARTEELFHSLDGQSADDIEKTVYAYVQSQIDEYGLDAEIVDVVVGTLISEASFAWLSSK